VNVLKDAGMVEIARLEEAGWRRHPEVLQIEYADVLLRPPRGQRPDTQRGAGTHNRGAANTTRESLYETHGDDIELVAEEMKPCEYCGTQHYEEFIIRELLNRALLELGETGDLDDVLSQAR